MSSSWIWPVITAPFIGSFVGVVATRTASVHRILWGRSECEACHRHLWPPDLVPLLSWLALRGHCRYCAERISVFHPLVELAAIVVAVWAIVHSEGWTTWATCGLGWTLLALAVTDARHYLLPDFLTLPLLATGILVNSIGDPPAGTPHLIGAIAGWSSIVAVREIYRSLRDQEGIGLGDAKLFAASGAWVSWDGLPSVLLIAASIGLLAMVFMKRRMLSLSDRVPFGTCLCAGTWLVWLYGPLT
jgi:leader peptidase (prepilin peptidase)/N-methyltransferase